MSGTMHMAVGFHSVGLHMHPIEVAIERLAAAGYDAIEMATERLPWASPHVTLNLSSGERRKLRRRVLDAGLAVSAVGSHVSMVEADIDGRRANLEYALGCIDLAAELGTDVSHLLSGPAPTGVPRREAFGWLVDGVARCIERGQARGVKVGFEPVVNQLVCNVAGLKELMKALDPLVLYVNYDPSHFQVHGDDPADAVRAFGPRIVHVHVKDAKGTPEDFQFPPLGQGDVDFPGVIAALKETGYRGYLSVEYEANAFGYVETEETIVGHGLRFVRQLLE